MSLVGISSKPIPGGKRTNPKHSDKNLSYYASAYYESVHLGVTGRDTKEVLTEFFGDIAIGMVPPKFFPPEAVMLQRIGMDRATAKRVYEKRVAEWDAQTIKDLQEQLAVQEETKGDKVAKFASKIASKVGGALKKALTPKPAKDSANATASGAGAAGDSATAQTVPAKNENTSTITDLPTAPKGNLEDRLEAGSGNKEVTELLKKIEANTSGKGADKKDEKEKEKSKGVGIFALLIGGLLKMGGPLAGLIRLTQTLYSVLKGVVKGIVGITKMVFSAGKMIGQLLLKLAGFLKLGAVGTALKEGAVKVGGKIASVASSLKDKAANVIKAVPDKVKAATLGKGLGKSILKKIPVVGLVAGLGFAAHRALKGDFAGAGMEVASGAASVVPGAGTAASIGIDAALAVRDMKKTEAEEARKTPAKALEASQAPVVPVVPKEAPAASVEASKAAPLPANTITEDANGNPIETAPVAAAHTTNNISPVQITNVIPNGEIVATALPPLPMAPSLVSPSTKSVTALFAVPAATLLERVSGTITKNMGIITTAKNDLKSIPAAPAPVVVTNQTNNTVAGSGGGSGLPTGMKSSRPSGILPHEEAMLSSMLSFG